MTKQLPFSRLTRILVGLAAKNCLDRGQRYITAMDFVFALLTDQRSPVIRCLSENGVDVKRLSDIVKSKLLTTVGTDPASLPKGSREFQEILSSAICTADRYRRSEIDSTIIFLEAVRARLLEYTSIFEELGTQIDTLLCRIDDLAKSDLIED